jgi:hypothetical protein
MDGTVKMVALANSPVALFDSPVAPKNVDRNADVELTHQINAKTYRQVANLNVVRHEERIIVRGQSQSYYVKQLATHAVLDLFPNMNIENAISVGR